MRKVNRRYRRALARGCTLAMVYHYKRHDKRVYRFLGK